MDDFCHSLNFVAAGIGQWVHDWRIRSHPAGHRRRRGADPGYSGTKTILAGLSLAGEGGYWERRWSAGPETFNRAMMPSLEKVLQPVISPQTYREE